MKIIPICGYAEQLSGSPGDTIEFKVSSTETRDYTTSLCRVICADPNPDGPGIIEQVISGELENQLPSQQQPFYPGSYAIARYASPFALTGFTLAANIWPTLLNKDYHTILSMEGQNRGGRMQLGLNARGCLEFSSSAIAGVLFTLPEALRLHSWYRVFASYDPRAGVMTMGFDDLEKSGKAMAASQFAMELTDFTVSAVSIAATRSPHPQHHFNGKIEAPALYTEALGSQSIPDRPDSSNRSLVSFWDFSAEISSTAIVDRGPAAAHAELVNLPTRAVMGSNWTGQERNWKHCPGQYAAIHFHDDDIYDFGWETSFDYTIPESLKPGVYCVNLRCGEHQDKIPFFVTARPAKPAARLCVLISTFTYVIYGNHARPDYTPSWQDHFAARNAYPWNPAEYSQYGQSTYNVHSDGSGICHASHRRPLMTLRPGYVTFGNTDCSGLRHFQADSHLITWLEQQGLEYDLITDQELQDHGMEILRSYSTLVTGTHPEYHTPAMLDALREYRKYGGNFVYLGGNGFYWKIAEHPLSKGTLEVRRAEGGIRAWAAEPGEYYQAFDGEYGGLWRRNNRPPQQLAGIGFSAQGRFTGSYYRRTPDSFTNPEVNWIFENVDDEVIGDFGLCGFGAAGFELDRMDHRLGSAENTIVLASSEGHDADFVLVPEERLTHITTFSGEPASQLIRADMVYQCNENGSQLFSTGSITFCGSLLHDAGNNNISIMLGNVIRRFTGH